MNRRKESDFWQRANGYDTSMAGGVNRRKGQLIRELQRDRAIM